MEFEANTAFQFTLKAKMKLFDDNNLTFGKRTFLDNGEMKELIYRTFLQLL